jgi:hypothetical protein
MVKVLTAIDFDTIDFDKSTTLKTTLITNLKNRIDQCMQQVVSQILENCIEPRSIQDIQSLFVWNLINARDVRGRDETNEKE